MAMVARKVKPVTVAALVQKLELDEEAVGWHLLFAVPCPLI